VSDPYRTAAAVICAPDIHSPHAIRIEAQRRLAFDLTMHERKRPPWWRLTARRLWHIRARSLVIYHERHLRQMLDAKDEYHRAVMADMFGWWPEHKPHSPHRPGLL